MKFKSRIGALVLSLVLVAFMTGCVSQQTYSGQRVRSARDFEVVETSTKRTLTTREMVHLKQKVEAYLEQEGVTENGDYYVKIFLGEEEGLGEGEWVVVRYTKEPAVRYSLLASSPGLYDPYYSSYAYDYYPFPYSGFTRLSFQYYDYPYYGYRHYPVSRRPHHGRGHHGDRDRKPDGRPDRDRDNVSEHRPDDGRPSGALKPSYKPPFGRGNVNLQPVNNPDPTLDETERKKRPPTRVDVRSRPRQRTITPGVPRPAPVGAPDYSVRRQIPAGNQAVSRPNINQRTSPPARPDAAMTRRTIARPSSPPVPEVRGVMVRPPSPASTFKPSAPRARPAPVRTAPVTRPVPAPVYRAPVERKESRQEASAASSSNDRVNRYDGSSREPRR